MEYVTLLSNGYEWTCPTCRIINTTIQVPKDNKVTCPICLKTFLVDDYIHAMET